MTDYIKQNRVALYAQPDGLGTAMKPLRLGKIGMADKTHPGTGRTPQFGTDEFGRFVTKFVQNEPPGGLNTSTIEEDDVGTITYLAKRFAYDSCFPLQQRYYECARLDSPNWDKLWHFGRMTITQDTEGAGPSREASGAGMFNSFEVSWEYTVWLLKHALTALTLGDDQNINDIAVLSDLIPGCGDCYPGYQPDEIIYIAVDANSGSPGDFANVWYSVNGGGTFAATSTNPFAALEDVDAIAIRFTTDDGFRVIVANSVNEIKYSDFTLGDEGTSSWSTALTVGTDIEAMKWLFYDRLYVAADGDIYVSDDQGDTVGSALYTGSTVINDIARNYAGDEVWAVGESNLILRERDQSGTFETLTGPSGGGTFYSVFVANDGRVYAGNGQSIYVSTNSAANTGGWTELKDFGSNKTVTGINCAGGSRSQGGDSQLLRVLVDDTAGGVGAVWESEDGGSSFRQVDTLTNTGYNVAYFSPIDDNLAFIGGDGGTLHKLAPKI